MDPATLLLLFQILAALWPVVKPYVEKAWAWLKGLFNHPAVAAAGPLDLTDPDTAMTSLRGRLETARSKTRRPLLKLLLGWAAKKTHDPRVKAAYWGGLHAAGKVADPPEKFGLTAPAGPLPARDADAADFAGHE